MSLKDFFNSMLSEDDEDEEFEEKKTEQVKEEKPTEIEKAPVIETEPVVEKKPEPVKVEPEIDYTESALYAKAFMPAEDEVKAPKKKSTIFDGLDVDSITSREKKPKQKTYKYDRNKSVKVRRVAEDLDYRPIISPIFGNLDDSKKEFDKVHDAIKLPKAEDVNFTKIISPMYGEDLPSMEPVDEIPEYTVGKKKPNKVLNLNEMLEKPKTKNQKQESLFDEKD